MASGVKREPVENPGAGEEGLSRAFSPPTVIDLGSSSSSSSSDSDSDSDLGEVEGVVSKKRKMNELGVVLPVGFLDPLPALMLPESDVAGDRRESSLKVSVAQSCKQFWKAGDYEGAPCGDWTSSSGN